MKTKDVINRLQELDPTGEGECCIDNADITRIDIEPAYWDGALQKFIYDEKGQIAEAKYIRNGTKIVFSSWTISSAVMDFDKLKVTFEGFSPERIAEYEKQLDEKRAHGNEIRNDVERRFFVNYIAERTKRTKEEVKELAENFYNQHLSSKDPLPDDIKNIIEPQVINGQVYNTIPSFNSRRSMQWDREIEMDFEDGQITLKRYVV